MDRSALDSLDKEALIRLILMQAEVIERLTKRVAEMEAKLGLPTKTPDNSSTPPSKGQKPSALAADKPRRRANRIPARIVHCTRTDEDARHARLRLPALRRQRVGRGAARLRGL
jgi:hypothetical protein